MLIIVVWYQFFTPLSQGYNLRAIKAWIEENDAGWQELVVKYPELKENVTLSAFSGGNGMLSVIDQKANFKRSRSGHVPVDSSATIRREPINLVLPDDFVQDESVRSGIPKNRVDQTNRLLKHLSRRSGTIIHSSFGANM